MSNLIGLETIGIAFAALHIKHSSAIVSVYDTRPDLEEYINSVFPGYIDSEDDSLSLTGRLKICSSLEEACQNATVAQEQGLESLPIKRSIWPQVKNLVSDTTHLWSSTSRIAASLQV